MHALLECHAIGYAYESELSLSLDEQGNQMQKLSVTIFTRFSNLYVS